MKTGNLPKQYAGALLITPSGETILQQRDNNPGIMNPGQITFFGGAVEGGETPDEAVIRELNEELGLVNIQPKPYKVLYKTQAAHGEDREMYLYLLHDIDPNKLRVSEGRGYVLVSKNDDLSKVKLTVFAHEVLLDYFSSL